VNHLPHVYTQCNSYRRHVGGILHTTRTINFRHPDAVFSEHNLFITVIASHYLDEMTICYNFQNHKLCNDRLMTPATLIIYLWFIFWPR